MMKKKLTAKHILLLLLYSPGKTNNFNESIIGRTRIIKMMFLFKYEMKSNFIKDSNIEDITLPDFYPWKFGPFSKDIYNDIEFFINNNFIDNEIIEKETPSYEEIAEFENWNEDYLFDDEKEFITSNIFQLERFKLHEKGERFIKEKVWGYLTDNQEIMLKEFKKKIVSASLNSILRYTYLKYPDFITSSNIKDKVLG